MKPFFLLFFVFLTGCKGSTEIKEVEILTYFTNAKEFQLYSSTGKNGFTQTLFRSHKDSIDNFQTRISKELMDSISAVCRNKNEKDFVFKSTKKMWYCGNWKMVRITYENDEKLVFKFPYGNAQNKQFLPFESLSRQVRNDSLTATRLNIGQLDAVYTKQKSLSDYAFKEDSVYIHKLLEKYHKKDVSNKK